MHICRLLVAIRHAQNMAIMSPGERLCSLTSFAPNQKACMNIAIIMNCAEPEFRPHSLLSFPAALSKSTKAFLARSASIDCALKALTVVIAETALSMVDAAIEVSFRSEERRGWANACERDWRTVRIGSEDRITRVKEKERRKARTRAAIVVVRCCRRSPEASEDALRTSSVSLCTWLVLL